MLILQLFLNTKVEKGFREREEKVIQELCQYDNFVLATGGGAVLSEQTRELLSSSGVVVYLQASIETILARAKNENSRPLLKSTNKREKVKEILKQRVPLYEEVANHIINTNRHTVNWTTEQILKIIR